jgi:hypothetical protein
MPSSPPGTASPPCPRPPDQHGPVPPARKEHAWGLWKPPATRPQPGHCHTQNLKYASNRRLRRRPPAARRHRESSGLEDLDYGYIDGIRDAVRKYPLQGAKKERPRRNLATSSTTPPACATTGSAHAACSSAPASSKPDARPSSARASSSPACTRPSQEPTPSSPCDARRPAAYGKPPTATVITRQQPPDQQHPQTILLAHKSTHTL